MTYVFGCLQHLCWTVFSLQGRCDIIRINIAEIVAFSILDASLSLKFLFQLLTVIKALNFLLSLLEQPDSIQFRVDIEVFCYL